MRFGSRQKPDVRRVLAGHHAMVGLALTLAACGHLQPQQSADGATRTPSLRVADAALATGAPEVALNVAQVVLEKDPHNVKALIARGDAYYAMRQRAQAEASYRAAIEADPGAAGAQVGLGRLLVQSDPAGAEAAFMAALKSDPVNVDALNNLGVVRDLGGHYAEAEDAYYHALMAAPDSVEVQINLGTSLALSGHGETALRLLRGVASDPNAAQAWHNELSHALAIAGDPGLAQQLADAGGTADTPAPTVVAAAPQPMPVPARPAKPAQVTQVAAVEPDPADMIPPESITPAPVVPVAKIALPGTVATAPPAIAIPAAPKVVKIAAPVQPRVAPPAKVSAKTAAIADVNASTPAHPDAPGNDAFVQLGSLDSEADARLEWQRLTKLASPLLAGHDPIVTQAEVRGRTYWRLRTFGFADAGTATDLCAELKAMAQRCWSGRGL